jgi:hypothetical protein
MDNERLLKLADEDAERMKVNRNTLRYYHRKAA